MRRGGGHDCTAVIVGIPLLLVCVLINVRGLVAVEVER